MTEPAGTKERQTMTDIRTFIEARLAEREALLCDLAAQMANSGENMRGGWNLWGEFGMAVHRLVNLHELADDIGAKRAILAEHTYNPNVHYGERGHTCAASGYSMLHDPCLTLRALAHPFRSHPDFDPAWRIEP